MKPMNNVSPELKELHQNCISTLATLTDPIFLTLTRIIHTWLDRLVGFNEGYMIQSSCCNHLIGMMGLIRHVVLIF